MGKTKKKKKRYLHFDAVFMKSHHPTTTPSSNTMYHTADVKRK